MINGEKTYISGVIEATKRGGGHLTLFRTAPELGNKGMTFAYVPAKTPRHLLHDLFKIWAVWGCLQVASLTRT